MNRASVSSASVVMAAGAAAIVLLVALAVGLGPAGVFDSPSPDSEQVPAVESVSGTEPVTVTYATANGTREFTVDGVDPAAVGENWAYLPRSALPAALEGVGNDPDAGVVAVGRWALVGDLTTATERIGGARLTVAAPAGMDVDPARKAGFLAAFVSPYTLDPTPSGPAMILIAPDALPSDGRMYGDVGYVTQHAFWDGDVASVWVHEFVHTRQDFALATEMEWFSEGSATYLSYRIMEEQYREVTEADVRARLAATPDFEDVPLAEAGGPNGSNADYYRGAKLLYAVDAEVRAGSGGTNSLVDVVRTMNGREGPITVEEFVAIVESHSGEEEDWLAAAIRERGDLDPYVRRNGHVFAD